MAPMFHLMFVVCKWQMIQVAVNRIQYEYMLYQMIFLRIEKIKKYLNREAEKCCETLSNM